MDLTACQFAVIRVYAMAALAAVFSSVMVWDGKPASDLFLLTAARTVIAPARCVVVEDSIAGVRAGVAAGMTVIGGHCLEDHSNDCSAGAAAVATSAEELGPLLMMRKVHAAPKMAER